MATARLAPRTALFLPASNPRAIEKARGLGADLVILDLEDAVRHEDKMQARAAAVAAAAEGFGGSMSAIRLNAIGSAEYDADVTAVAASACDFAILPKAESPDQVSRTVQALEKPLLVMIETPSGVFAAERIAAVPGVAGLIAGTNDLRAELGVPEWAGRGSIAQALQLIVLAARAHRRWVIDGVFNKLDDAAGLKAECHHGRSRGFDGKSLIHPNQIAIAAEAFGPTSDELAEAHALIDAASGGAQRFRDRMIESMHVDQAKALIARGAARGH